MKIIKRDGREVDFDRNKIISAIGKANSESRANHEKTLSDDEIKNIATVWGNKYPEITNEFEEAICDGLIEHHFVKVRKGVKKRIMLDNHHKSTFILD